MEAPIPRLAPRMQTVKLGGSRTAEGSVAGVGCLCWVGMKVRPFSGMVSAGWLWIASWDDMNPTRLFVLYSSITPGSGGAGQRTREENR